MTQTPKQAKDKRYNDKRSKAGYWHSEKFRELERVKGRRKYSRRKKFLETYAKAHPERIAARQAVRQALRSGKLIQTNMCAVSICENPMPYYAHHYAGYNKPHWLDIIWLCQEHHRKAHSNV